MHHRRSARVALPLLAAAPTFLLAASAYAFPCHVGAVSDPSTAAQKLRNCVDQVNAGTKTSILFDAPQAYLLTKPLLLERDITIYGKEQLLMPDPAFTGDALIYVGSPCPSGGCPPAFTANLKGLRFHGNGVQDVRALRVLGHDAYLDNVRIDNFDFTGDGGGVYSDPGSYVQFTDSTLASCSATRGGAIFGAGGKIVLDNTEVLNNDAANGGGVALDGSIQFTVFNSLLQGNAASADGGAVYMVTSTPSITMSDSVLSLNEAQDDGGGVYGGGAFERCRFEGNIAFDWGGGARLGPHSVIRDSTFDGNEAYRGGGVSIAADGNHDMFILQSTFANNTAEARTGSRTRPAGGGIYVGIAATGLTGRTRVTNSTLSGNSSNTTGVVSYAGGIAIFGSKATLDHVTLSGNEAILGGSVYSTSSAATHLELRSSIVAGTNSAPACNLTGTTVEDTSLDNDGSCGVTYSNVDPQLDVLADNGGVTETHLPASSVVLGAGTCYSTIDQRGDARPATNCDLGSVHQ